MSQDTLFPLGEFGFLINPIDRAAHLRDDAEKLFALEGKPNSRAYVIHRDSVLMKQDGDEVRAALTIKEALGFGANPGTIFIGLRDGAPYFGMGIPQQAAEKLAGRNDVVVEPLRNRCLAGHRAAVGARRGRGRKIAGAFPPAPRVLLELRLALADGAGRLEARVPELQDRALFRAPTPW